MMQSAGFRRNGDIAQSDTTAPIYTELSAFWRAVIRYNPGLPFRYRRHQYDNIADCSVRTGYSASCLVYIK
jgi:hypothetical protein